MIAVERLRVLVVAPERHALRQPHAGGLEAVVWNRVRWLRRQGHTVFLCAADGSDFLGPRPELRLPRPRWGRPQDASDSTSPDGHDRRMAGAFDRLRDLLDARMLPVDVVDNHSLHGDPILWSRDLGLPVVTTLHTPPLPGMVRAARMLPGRAPHRFLAVSQFTARAWSDAGVDSFVFPNGVDADQWHLGAGGPGWVWFGRIVPEKAPHLAIRAAQRAGARLRIAGRIGDAAYFAREVEPLLGGRIEYLGPLGLPALSDVIGASAVALVTPVWDEPFGLVAAEALMTGTPVAAFDAGGIGEVLAGMPATTVVPTGDVGALGRAAAGLAALSRWGLPRGRIRDAAEARYSLEQRHREIERVLSVAANGAALPALVTADAVGSAVGA